MKLWKQLLAALGREPSTPIEEELTEMSIIEEMTPEELIRAAENVMACREAINTLLNMIAVHRSDGHECLPYCMSTRLHEALLQLDEYQTRMLLTVVLKDVFDSYYREHLQQHER